MCLNFNKKATEKTKKSKQKYFICYKVLSCSKSYWKKDVTREYLCPKFYGDLEIFVKDVPGFVYWSNISNKKLKQYRSRKTDKTRMYNGIHVYTALKRVETWGENRTVKCKCLKSDFIAKGYDDDEALFKKVKFIKVMPVD